jgi:hypothetical protein
VFLEGDPEGAPSFFAKIAFPYALWNPDRSVHYDVARTANEFKIMKRFKEMLGEDAPVAKPYLCVDVEDTGMKILVVEWTSNADEQWANQFIDGEVDHRVIPKLAKALAALNLAPLTMNSTRCLMIMFVRACAVCLISRNKSLDKW